MQIKSRNIPASQLIKYPFNDSKYIGILASQVNLVLHQLQKSYLIFIDSFTHRNRL